ncbi:CNH domain-containing protein [Mrakia frigida]|uniref:CNH domain-containing protein n=1 Tax=Mrakia frigida TaxID=29902 RepID=UPI003FCC2425
MISSYQQGMPRGDSKVFELLPLSRSTFHKKPPVQSHSSTSSASRPPSSNAFNNRGGRPPSGSVTCYVPFRTRDPGSREYLAVGCEDGVWIGIRGRDETFQQVMSVKHVQQIEFLAEADLILLLADNALFFYPLSTLLAPAAPPTTSHLPTPTPPPLASRSSSSSLRPQHQSNSSSSSTPRSRSPGRGNNTVEDHQSPQRLSGQAKVQFFQVGELQGRSLVIYAKKKGINDCIFRCLEWVVAGDGGGGRKADRFGSWRMYKEFFIPSEAHFIKFLRSKVAIGCEKGVEILDLATLQGGTIPVLPAVPPGVAALASTFGLAHNGNGGFDSTPQVELTLPALAKKCEGAVPLGIGRVDQGEREGEFLLVYETFAIYLSSKGGHPTPPLLPVSFSTHSTSASFAGNHLILVSANFIEVRNVATGELVQMMSGKNIRKVWEERGAWREMEGLPAYNAAASQGPSMEGGGGESRRGRIGVVMDEVGMGGGVEENGDGMGVGQIIYELAPIQPELALPPLPPPPPIGTESYPPSPPLAGLERTRSFARPAASGGAPSLPPLDVDVDSDLVDYFHAL